jgi:hypothetical protein
MTFAREHELASCCTHAPLDLRDRDEPRRTQIVE